MNKKVIIIIASVASILIIASILFLCGVIKIDIRKEKGYSKEQAICFVRYMDSSMLVDADGIVVGNSMDSPADISEIKGISFNNIIAGSLISPKDVNQLDYAIKIADNLRKNSILVNSIYISPDLSATVYINKVKIIFGKDKDTEEKIRDLRDFFDELKSLSGTMDMTELSENNAGYTLKPN